ncbi:hypothetical protein DFH08DRAFT_1025021 [Mycena albidolilacea]|uniref:Uncharacterized protein n=1 Tax=Mycena albidolilacea TaxID=1033008 RepID=A0AAD7AM49_9AGAR|nr:hypothetical protein DFH08DRAFT_1025021 [Mycena albidolilacea]
MPPKGSGAGLKAEDFVFRAERTEVQCRVCNAGLPEERRVWLLARNGVRHLQSDEHKNAVEQMDDARRIQEQRRAAVAQNVPIRVVQIPGPIADRPTGAHASGAELDMWADYAQNGAMFSAGDIEDDIETQQRLAQQVDIFGLLDPKETAERLGFEGDAGLAKELLQADAEDDFLAEIMANAGLDEQDPADVHADASEIQQEGNTYFPYPNKTIFLLNILDNMPRLRVSSSLMRVFLWMLRESGAKDVPSFDRLRQVQKEIRAEYGVPSIPCKSPLGNVFFINDPRTIIAQDWANPAVRAQMHVYPEIPDDGVVREIWHALKWRKNMDLDVLSPMYDAGTAHYYVNELARLKNGDFVVPIRWLMYREKVHADAFVVSFNETGHATIDDSKTVIITASELSENYLDLQDKKLIPHWSAETENSDYIARMPNPKREIAGGDPLYVTLVDFFGDDVSGNRSKSWNKHLNAYMTNRTLPRKLLQQEFHVHFVSTSPHASMAEQFQEFKTAVEDTHSNPVRVQDENGQTTRFCIYCNCTPSDNPMQSEICGHIGGKGNKFCRKCHVGGTQEEKTTPTGYHALFEPGELRTKKHTLTELKKQVELACDGVSKRVQELQTQTGVKDVYTQYWIQQILARATDMRQQDPHASEADIKTELIQWTRDNEEKLYSPFLTLKGFDPAADTPVELLHTILLGAVKYIWHISHTPWSTEKKKTYSIRLQATSTEGLSIHAIRANYIMQYAGSLIGRQFKTIIQTAVFHLHDLVTEDQFTAWKAVGELSALLWVPEIRDLTQYRNDLKIAVANVLDAVAQIDPSKIMTKIKYHLLTHLDFDAIELGPLIAMATEIFESFNAVFRYCSIYSNHLAPSRDIAIQFGRQETVKHQLSGGRWMSKSTGDWHGAGTGVRHFIEKHPILQRLVGWTPEKQMKHGDTKLAPLKRGIRTRPVELLKSTNAAHALNFGEYSGNSEWMRCKTVVSESLDECFVGTWLGVAIVVVELFQIMGVRHSRYGMPVLARRDDEITFSILPAKSIKFDFNTQHDCVSAACEATGVRPVMQERVESDKTENFIVHTPLDRFIINTHSFHNPHLVRATVSRDLWAPVALFEDRRAKHDEFSARLRESRATKAAKRKDTAAKKRPRPATASSDDDEPPRRARKRGRTLQAATRSGVPRPRTRAAAAAVASGSTMIGLAAGRSKRKIKRSARALQAEESESSDSESDGDGDSDGEEFNSGDDFLG